MEENRCPGCMNIKSGGAVCEHCGYDEGKTVALHWMPFLREGTILQKKYLVGRVLGSGKFGITYLGWNRYLNMKVVIKECYPSSCVLRADGGEVKITGGTETSFKKIKTAFLQEAKLLAKLRGNPQIVNVLDFFQENNTDYMVMEYLEGVDLREYVIRQGGRLTPEETFRIMRPIMEALIRAHKEGLLHCDITPHSIMMLHDSSAKLMEFGGLQSSETGMDILRKDEIVGDSNPASRFAPIEIQTKRLPLDARVDEYALCTTMYYCMTGSAPPDIPDRLFGAVDLDWNKLEGLTERQKEALQKGAAIHAKDRYPDICQLMDALFGAECEFADAQSEYVWNREMYYIGEEERKRWIKCQHNTQQCERRTGWQTINGQKYYFGSDGEVLTGWRTIEDGRYYLEEDGKIKTGWLEVSGRWFCFDRNGEMVTGWREIAGNTYYFNREGTMTVGWLKRYGDWYYFNQFGEMVSGWQEIDGNKYYFDQYGQAVTGWKEINGERYYFDGNGKVLTGMHQIDGRYCVFDNDGRFAYGFREENKLLERDSVAKPEMTHKTDREKHEEGFQKIAHPDGSYAEVITDYHNNWMEICEYDEQGKNAMRVYGEIRECPQLSTEDLDSYIDKLDSIYK